MNRDLEFDFELIELMGEEQEVRLIERRMLRSVELGQVVKEKSRILPIKEKKKTNGMQLEKKMLDNEEFKK